VKPVYHVVIGVSVRLRDGERSVQGTMRYLAVPWYHEEIRVR